MAVAGLVVAVYTWLNQHGTMIGNRYVSKPTTGEQALNRAAFDRWQVFCESTGGQAIMFLWAFAEAIFFPLIPDFLLVPMAAGARRHYWRLLGAAVFGSALGGVITYLFAYLAPAPAETFLQHLPFVQPAMLSSARAMLEQQGVAAFWIQPWSGLSYKIFAVLGGVRGLDPVVVIPISTVARGGRMFINSIVINLLAKRLPSFFRDYWIYLVLAYLVLFGYGWLKLLTSF